MLLEYWVKCLQSSYRENFPDREFSLPKHQNFGYAPLEIKRRFEWKSNKKVIHKIDFCIPTSAAVVVKNDYSSVEGINNHCFGTLLWAEEYVY